MLGPLSWNGDPNRNKMNMVSRNCIVRILYSFSNITIVSSSFCPEYIWASCLHKIFPSTTTLFLIALALKWRRSPEGRCTLVSNYFLITVSLKWRSNMKQVFLGHHTDCNLQRSRLCTKLWFCLSWLSWNSELIILKGFHLKFTE